MISTDNSGIACCGNCGGHVVVACQAGCAEPDVQFRDNYIAALPVPRGKEPRQEHREPPAPKAKKVAKYPVPTHCKCGEPVVAKPAGRGRPPTKCVKHWNPRSKREAKAAEQFRDQAFER